MTKIGQFNVGIKKTVWTWCCPSCKQQLEEQVANKPVSSYLTDPEAITAATIRLVLPKEEEQKQQEQEALTAA